MTLPNTFPSRVWLCPGCGRQFMQRWLLARHLRTVHRLRKEKADGIAFQCEYVLAPRYVKRSDFLEINPNDYESEEDEDD
jgi:hypothetical protein